MEQIKSLNEYKELIRWNKSRFDAVSSNCMLLAENFRNYIAEQRLYREIYDNGIALYVDETNYFNFYYFWKKDAPLAVFRQNKPVLLEELSNNGSRDGYIRQFESELAHAGFQLIRNNLQVEKKCDQNTCGEFSTFNNDLRSLKDNCLHLEYCKDEETMMKVAALWEDYLDPTDIPASHFSYGAPNIILNIKNEMGDVAATNFWTLNKKSSECRHTVTHPDYHKKGLATLLLKTWIYSSMEQGVVRWSTWISDRNSKSLALCQKLGFKINGRTCKQYIL